MNSETVVGIVSVVASLVASFTATFGGILINSKLTNHRISELEKRFDKIDASTEGSAIKIIALEQQNKDLLQRVERNEQMMKDLSNEVKEVLLRRRAGD